jgi:hypothetical protein
LRFSFAMFFSSDNVGQDAILSHVFSSFFTRVQ